MSEEKDNDSDGSAAQWQVSATGTIPLWRQCADHVLDLIKNGELEPGEKLPCTIDLAKKMDIGVSTLQKTLSWLTAEGVLERHRNRGTFVAGPAAVNQQTLIAVMTRAMFDPSISRWDYEAARATVDVLADAGVACRFYHNQYNAEGPDADCQEIDPRLIDDINAGRVRGVLVIGSVPLSHPEFRELLKSRNVPLVETTGRGKNTPFIVEFDRPAHVKRAVDLAAEAGCKGLALIETPGSEHAGPDPLADAFLSEVEAKGIVTCPKWCQRIAWPPDAAKGAAAFFEIWQQKGKPDGLIVTDEYVAQGVTQSAFAAGIGVPDDLWICTSTTGGAKNLLYPVPTVTVEFDADELIRAAWGMLSARINGEVIRQRHIRIGPRRVNHLNSYLKESVESVNQRKDAVR